MRPGGDLRTLFEKRTGLKNLFFVTATGRYLFPFLLGQLLPAPADAGAKQPRLILPGQH